MAFGCAVLLTGLCGTSERPGSDRLPLGSARKDLEPRSRKRRQVAELREELKKLQQPTTGRKDELIQRLQALLSKRERERSGEKRREAERSGRMRGGLWK